MLKATRWLGRFGSVLLVATLWLGLPASRLSGTRPRDLPWQLPDYRLAKTHWEVRAAREDPYLA